MDVVVVTSQSEPSVSDTFGSDTFGSRFPLVPRSRQSQLRAALRTAGGREPPPGSNWPSQRVRLRVASEDL